MNSGRGHRSLPHTADVILEAWGPSLAACLEEAAAALADTYVETDRTQVTERVRVRLAANDSEGLLLALLNEMIFRLDTSTAVPVGAEVRESDDGGLDAELLVADGRDIRPAGSAPKAVSHSELRLVQEPGRVWCRVLVDV